MAGKKKAPLPVWNGLCKLGQHGLDYPSQHCDVCYPDFWQKLREGGYETDSEFRAALLDELGITDNPKAELLYSKAWQLGHSCGYSEVASYAADLVDLIR